MYCIHLLLENIRANCYSCSKRQWIQIWPLIFINNCFLSELVKETILQAEPDDSVSKEDKIKLIEIIETCRPLWNYKLSIRERSETIKKKLVESFFCSFNGK